MKLEFSEDLLKEISNLATCQTVSQTLAMFLEECVERKVKGKLVITFDMEKDNDNSRNSDS